MKVTYQELKKTFPEEKKSIESLYGRIIPVRKMSYIITIPFLWADVSAFFVSVLSVFIAILACVLLSLPHSYCRIAGIVAIFIWHLCDCVDGNIARFKKSASCFGSTVDAISGYYFFALFPLAFGIASFNISENYFNVPSWIFLILGALASIFNLLMRLIHQKYCCAEFEFLLKNGSLKEGKVGVPGKQNGHIKKLQVEFGPLGIPMFVLWIAPVFNLFHILTVYYFVFFVASGFAMTVLYLWKCYKRIGVSA